MPNITCVKNNQRNVKIKKTTHLARVGDNSKNADTGKLINELIDFLFDPELIMQLSWTGSYKSSGQKLCFQKYQSIIDVIYEVLYMVDCRHSRARHEDLLRDNIFQHSLQQLERKRKTLACAAYGCDSNSLSGIGFFRFPKNFERAKIWMERVGRDDLMQKSFSEHRICSLHFKDENISINQTRSRLVGDALPIDTNISARIKADIKRWSRPSEIKLEVKSPSSLDVIDTYDGYIPEASGTFVDLSQFLEIKSEVEDTPLTVKSDPLEFLPPPKEYVPNTLRPYLETVQTFNIKPERYDEVSDISSTKRQIIKRTAIVTASETGSDAYVKKRKTADLKSIVKILKDKNLVEAGNCDRLEELCEPIIEDINNGIISKLSNQYTPKLRALVLHLNFYSPKAFGYVRTNFIRSLPQPSILCGWYKNFNAKPGLTSESFDYISKQVAAINKDGKDLFLNLVFDEMTIKSQIEWTGTNSVGFIDAGDGTETTTAAKLIFVLMVVCVTGSWKIPIGFFPIESMSAEQKANIIIESIHAVNETGAKLIGVTCDGCASNISTATLLGCDVNLPTLNPTFTVSGVDGEFLMVFDPVQMVKLVRNTLADRGPFIDGSNALVDWNYMKTILELPETTIGIDYSRKQRIKLMFVSQILSDCIADALEYCNHTLNIKQFSDSDGTVNFIRICNKVFDILNSRQFYNDGYEKFDSLGSSNINEILNFSLYAINYFSTLKLANGLLLVESIYKTGFIGIILGLKTINILHMKYISYGRLIDIPFYKLSRNHIELFFGLIRHKLSRRNPTVRQFIEAYRKLVIGNCLSLVELPVLQQNKNSSIKFINSTILNKLATNDKDDDTNTSDRYKNLEDLSHLLDLDRDFHNPNEYHEFIVAYIAGLVVFNLQTKLKCEECIKLLESNKCRIHEGFTSLSSCGLVKKEPRIKLKIASKDILKICLCTEKVVSDAISIHNDRETFILGKQRYAQILIEAQNLCHSRLIFTKSSHVHRPHLVRGTIEEYLNIRHFYLSLNSKSQITIIVYN